MRKLKMVPFQEMIGIHLTVQNFIYLEKVKVKVLKLNLEK
jgi:hypothetical protein